MAAEITSAVARKGATAVNNALLTVLVTATKNKCILPIEKDFYG